MKSYRLINNSDRKKQWGTITIQVEELSNQNADVTLEFAIQSKNINIFFIFYFFRF